MSARIPAVPPPDELDPTATLPPSFAIPEFLKVKAAALLAPVPPPVEPAPIPPPPSVPAPPPPPAPPLPPKPDTGSAARDAAEHFNAGRFEDAVAAADRWLSTYPRDGEVLNTRAQALFKLGRRDEAGKAIVKAIEASPASLPFWLNKTEMEQEEGKAKQACRSAMDLVEIAMNDETETFYVEKGREIIAAFEEKGVFPNARGYLGWLGLGCVSMRVGRPEAALEFFDRAIDAASSNAGAFRWKGKALTQLDQLDEALALFDAALEIAPDDPEVHYDRGLAFAILGDSDRAIESFDAALALDPHHAESLAERKALGGEPKTKAAPPAPAPTIQPAAPASSPPPAAPPVPAAGKVETTKKGGAAALPEVSVPKTAPKYSQDECLKRSETARGQALFDAALDFADQAIAADPRKYTAWLAKSEALFGLKRYAESAAHAKKAIELNPKFAQAWVRLASSFDALLANDEALAAWDTTLELAGQNVLNWTGKGLCLARMGRLEEALACHDRSLEIDPRYSPGEFHKAMRESDLGRTDEAIKSLERFLSIAPATLNTLIQEARQVLEELKA